MAHPTPASFPTSSFPSSSPLPLSHQLSAHPTALSGAPFYSTPSGPQSAPVLSAPGSLAPSTSSSSIHSGMPQLPFVGSDGSGAMQHPVHSPMQSKWNNNSFNTFPTQQPTPQQPQQQQQQQQAQPQQYPVLHNQLSLPAAGRLSSHESSAPMTAYSAQVNMTTPAYQSVLFTASQQQQQPQAAQAQHRFQTTSPPMPASHNMQQQQHQQHQQQQQYQQQQQQQQLQQPQQQPQQQPHPQQAHMQPNQMQPNLQSNMQPAMHSTNLPSNNMMYSQFNMQPHNQQFNGQQPHPTATSYAQPSPTSFPAMRMAYAPQQQQQQQQQPPLHDRQTSTGPTVSPHSQQPQQQSQPPSSPRHPQQFVGNFSSGGQMSNMQGMGVMQSHPSQPQPAGQFFNGYLTPAASSTSLAPNQPAGAQMLNYSQSMPVAMAPSHMPSAVVMASTASAPSTYTAVHHQRNKAARHHPLASTAAASPTEAKGAVGEAEGSSESTTPTAGSPSAKPADSPVKSKFPRPSASSHPPFQLLKTESKRPYATLLYTANKRMLPSFLAKKQALFGQEQPPPPPDSPDMVTIKVRVMALNILTPPALPLLSTLYFVAADISAIIHSRKSNIAKAVSSFPDDEKKRASVLCMQQNGTVSTHSLTVLSWKGVERLLNFSCAPVALPFLEWLRCEVHKISSPDPQTALAINGGDSGKLNLGGEAHTEVDGKGHVVHANGSSRPDTATTSPSAADSSEEDKLESPHQSLPDTPAHQPHQQQQQAVA